MQGKKYAPWPEGRWFWLLPTLLILWVGADTLSNFVIDPGRHTVSQLPGGICLILMTIICIRVGGYTQFAAKLPHSPTDRIPTSALWSLHIPFAVALFGMGVFAHLEYLEPYITVNSRLTPTRLLIMAIAMYAAVLGALLVRGHKRRLRFTPASLEYERGWFTASSIPWDEILHVQTVCDANLKTGGVGELDKSTAFNVRAGVHLTVGSGATTRGLGPTRAMKHHDGRHDVIHIDCSEYRIDPNTLINAIHLLAHNPELRPLLDSREGTEIFRGPDWNTRRRMRVGDTWNRTTDQIIPAAESARA